MFGIGTQRYSTVRSCAAAARKRKLLCSHSNLMIVGSILYILVAFLGVVPWSRQGYLLQVLSNAMSLHLLHTAKIDVL